MRIESVPGIVIVGSGLAGWTVARELRRRSPSQAITLVSRDDGHFYPKPALSNALAAGKTAAQLVTTPGPQMAALLGIDLWPRTEVTAIDTGARVLRTSHGILRYGSLVLALGADPIRLPIGGDAAQQVLSVNDLDDYVRLRERLAGARQVTVLGAGLIGCEFANDLVLGGFAVDVVDLAPQPLGRLLPVPAARRVQSALAAIGVRWHLGVTAQRVDPAGGDAALQVRLSDGTVLAADCVVSAVGLRPRTALAAQAGLAVGRGIVTDAALRTSAPDVYALGDCAEIDGRTMPYVMPIMHAARALAATLAGTPAEVAWPPMPVVVKTPAVPVVVAPPADADGRWELEAGDTGIEARFVDAGGTLRGFALVGAATSAKAALTKRLADAAAAPA